MILSIIVPICKKGVEKYSHVQILWWADGCDNDNGVIGLYYIDARNIPSHRILEKCNYTREEFIRQGKMVNTWCDYYIYGILASDVL